MVSCGYGGGTMMKLMPFILSVGVLGCVVGSPIARASVWTVDNDGADFPQADFTTIQAAIDTAVDGDVIHIYTGSYSLNAAEVGPVIDLLGKSLELTAMGSVIVSGQAQRRCIECTSGEGHQTVITGLTCINGKSALGGGIYCVGSSPVFVGCTISGCTAQQFGGGVFLEESLAEFHDCDITNNLAGGALLVEGGGIYTINGAPLIDQCQITGNTTSGIVISKGGGIRVAGGDLTIVSSYLKSNTSQTIGGGLSTESGRTTAVGLIFCGNEPDHVSGHIDQAEANVFAFSCVDSDQDGRPNEADQVGDGVHHVPSEYPSILAAVMAAGNGDEIIVGPGTRVGTGDSIINTRGKHLTIRSSDGAASTILDGQDARRIVSCSHGESHALRIEGFTFRNGWHPQFGGAVRCEYSTPHFVDCIMLENWVDYDGGVFYCKQADILVENCLMVGNEALSNGGAVRCKDSSPRFIRCDFQSNFSEHDGGAIEVDSDSEPIFISCDFRENFVSAGFSGGAIRSLGNPILIDTIFCENTPNYVWGPWTNASSNVVWGDCEDCNGDGIADVNQIGLLLSDVDGDGRPDQCEGDCDEDGTPDPIEINNGTQLDANGDGIPDECVATWIDCDGDGQIDLDACLNGLVDDCNANLVPDSCEINSGDQSDCNGNGQIDSCDLLLDPSIDCDNNGIIDACDANTDLDCDFSGVPDVCELADGLLEDLDGNGQPDICRCVGDVVEDDVVDLTDLLHVLNQIGQMGGSGDADWSGNVDIIDVLVVLHHWGGCGGPIGPP